jgi:heme-degrading monooxygenase HmoA
MFAVIFEVHPKKDKFDDYLHLAASLKPTLEKMDGFIDNERFRSTRDAERLVSLSIWRDEKAVIRWRTQGNHHEVQEKGRFEVFEDYHLRVGEIVADSDSTGGQPLPEQRFDETEIGDAKTITLSEFTPLGGNKPSGRDLAIATGLAEGMVDGVVDQEVFESITHPGKLLLLVSWRDLEAAREWKPGPLTGSELRHRLVRVIRDYSMHDRREAPQYYPAVERVDNSV